MRLRFDWIATPAGANSFAKAVHPTHLRQFYRSIANEFALTGAVGAWQALAACLTRSPQSERHINIMPFVHRLALNSIGSQLPTSLVLKAFRLSPCLS